MQATVPTRARLGVAAMIVAVALTACQGSSQSQKSTTMVVLADDVATCLDVDGPCTGSLTSIQAFDNIYDLMLSYQTTNQNGVQVPDYSRFAPRLATSWTQDGLTWTFHLRQGVKSCAGNPFTADDVVYSFARGKSVSGTAPIIWFLGNVASVFPLAPVLPNATAADKQLMGEAVKVDDYTVQIKQFAPNGLFPMVLTIALFTVFDSKEMKKHATAADPWSHTFATSEGAAGFGPYCLNQWTPGQSMTLTANPGSYIKPHFTKVVMTKVPQDANRYAAIVNGQADLVGGLTPKEYQDLSTKSNVSVLGWLSNQNLDLFINYNSPPWNLPTGKLLRQAVADAVPYDTIINNIYFGKAKRFNNMGIPPGYVGQVDFPPYNTDLNKAKDLLAQAGFPGGSGLQKYSDGLKLTYVSERQALMQPIALYIQSALVSIGMPVTLDPINQAEYSTRRLTQHNVPFVLDDNSLPLGTDANYALQLNYVTSAKGGLDNNVNYSNPSVDADWAKAKSLPNGPERNAVLADAQQILWNDVPWVPIVIEPSQIAVRKGIINWVGTADTRTLFWGFTEA